MPLRACVFPSVVWKVLSCPALCPCAADHCTAHVVDVSMNYAALINRVGLATSSAGAFSSLSDKEAAVYTLAAILAAVIHE